jgi:hypothetical protein
MFFESNEVNKLLNCKKCDGRLDEPKILPCGNSICSYCAASIKLNGKQYDCLVCREQHKMPKKGLPLNTALKDLLAYKPSRVSRGNLFDSLQKSLNDIQKKHNFIKLGIENSNDLVKEHCIDLRSDVQLTAEEVIQQVNDMTTKLIEKIDEFEKDTIQFNNNNSKSLDAFNVIAKELESFHAINTEYLKKYEVDDTLLSKLNEDATNLMNKVESEIESLKQFIFNGKKLKFIKNSEKSNKAILGELKLGKEANLNSFILPEIEKIKDLMALCEFSSSQEWNLIYRASQDGFEAHNFHSKCDDKPNTLIVIKSENGNVFGGYTEQSWSGSGYDPDPNLFIFSFINKVNKPLKMKWKQNRGIGSRCGPTFGGSLLEESDIYITDKPKKNLCHSNLGTSFVHPDYVHGSNEAKTFLADSYKFKVSEIEVFTKS